MGEDVGFERVARGGRELWCQPYMQPVLCWDGTRHRTALPDTARHGIPIGRSSVSVMWQCVCLSVCLCVLPKEDRQSLRPTISAWVGG